MSPAIRYAKTGFIAIGLSLVISQAASASMINIRVNVPTPSIRFKPPSFGSTVHTSGLNHQVRAFDDPPDGGAPPPPPPPPTDGGLPPGGPPDPPDGGSGFHYAQ